MAQLDDSLDYEIKGHGFLRLTLVALMNRAQKKRKRKKSQLITKGNKEHKIMYMEALLLSKQNITIPNINWSFIDSRHSVKWRSDDRKRIFSWLWKLRWNELKSQLRRIIIGTVLHKYIRGLVIEHKYCYLTNSDKASLFKLTVKID